MAIVDSQGRLFGKFSLLDVGAAIVILMVLVGIFLFPGTGGSVAQVGSDRQPVEVDTIVRGLSAADPKSFMQAGKKVNILVRKQPSGTVTLKEVKYLPRTVATPQPDGSLKAIPDPRPELNLTTDMMLTLTSDAQVVEGTPVLGGEKVKVGTTLELDGATYNFASSVVAVRVGKKGS